MKAIITRIMTVANDKGEAESFKPGAEPVEITDDVFGRLRRAGAAYPYVEPATSSEVVGDNLGTPSDQDFDKLDKAELIEYAETASIDIDASAKKADIIAAIKARIAAA